MRCMGCSLVIKVHFNAHSLNAGKCSLLRYGTEWRVISTAWNRIQPPRTWELPTVCQILWNTQKECKAFSSRTALDLHSAWPQLGAVGNSEQREWSFPLQHFAAQRVVKCRNNQRTSGNKKGSSGRLVPGRAGLPSTFQNEVHLMRWIHLRKTMCHVHSQFD